MSLRNTSGRQVLAGLLTGLAVGLLLTALVVSGGHRRLDGIAAQQRAVIATAAAAEALAAAGTAGADAAAVQALAERLVAEVPELDELRVLDVGSRSLLASTHAADREAGAPPRRLTRDEKPLYDQGRELQAARRTNAEEAQARKNEVLAELLPDGRLQLVVPVMDGAQVTGAVQTWCRVAAPDAVAGRGRLPWLVAAGCVVVFLVVLRLVPGARTRVLFSLVLLAAALWLHADLAIDGLATHREQLEAGLRDHALEMRETLTADLAGVGTDPAAWDLDRYGQPRGRFDADGVLDLAAVRAAAAPALRRFGQSAAFLGLLALVLQWWVAGGHAVDSWRALRRHRHAYGFVLPAMLGMIVLVFFPFAYGVLLSFFGQTLYNVNEPLFDHFVGFDNYVQILRDIDVFKTAEDGSRSINFQSFYWTLGFTVLWTASNVTIGVSLGLVLALILNTRGLALRPLYRIILILPWAVPNYITALIWKGMFHKQFGVINQIVQIFGGEPIAWFDGWVTSFFAVLMTNGWLSFPFMMVVSLGALQSIPGDLYEAARVDGAGKWQQFRFVTLPSLKPALVPAVILSVVWTFNMFNIIYLVSQGEPAGATEILITQAYKIAFEQYRYSYAAAYSVVIFLILLSYGIWQNRTTKATEGI